MVVATGTELGGYQILSLLGEGGMGAVYRAYDPSLHRFVALKVLHEGHADNAARRRTLLREARSASALNHPHICTIHEVGEADGEAFMIMEFVEGRSLRDLIATDALPHSVAIRYAIQIADALAHAHDRRILHRDLKTGNVMITSDGRVKVLDFGLASRLGDEGLEVSPESTATVAVAQITGTLAYMAPELLEGDRADARSDVWSLGVVLYEIVAGTLPFSGRTTPELSAAILRETPKLLPADVPAGLRRTILRCLSKEPAQRYRHAREVVAALETTGEDAVLPVPKKSTRSLSAGTGIFSGARRVGWRPAAALGFSALVIGALWWYLQQDPSLRVTGNHLVSSLPQGSVAASFSPDGSMVAFQNSDVSGVPQVWLKSLAQSDPLPVTTLEQGATRPCWSPKGDQILFNHRGSIWTVPPLGGQPRPLIEKASNPSFSRDGEHVAYETPDRGIWLASADSSNPRRIAVRRHTFEATPALSPDGQAIAYFESDDGGPMGDFWIVSASAGAPRRLTFDNSHSGKVIWTPDGRFIIFSSMRHGSENLWRVPAKGGSPEPVTFGAGQDRDPALSPNGKQLIYTNTRAAFVLMLLDPATGRETELLERRSAIDLPRFSHQGDRIVFFHQVEADIQLFTIRVDGQELRQLTHTAGQRTFTPQWSADDASVFFTRSRPDASFRKIAVTGGESMRLGEWDVQNWAEADPSGNLVAYQRLDGTQPTATVIRTLATGLETVLDRLLIHFRWSRDGKTILGHNAGSILSCPAGPGECQVIANGWTPRPSGDSSQIFFLRATNPRSRHRELWSIARDGRDGKRVGTVGPFFIDTRFDVSRDDRIVFVRYREAPAELWRADLR
jgi:eukaryotic-like serine/threonine-protein kinase